MKYRMLRKGEPCKAGDEYKGNGEISLPKKWIKISRAYKEPGLYSTFKYRRPIKPKQHTKSCKIMMFSPENISGIRKSIYYFISNTWWKTKVEFEKNNITKACYQYEIEIRVKKIKIKGK